MGASHAPRERFGAGDHMKFDVVMRAAAFAAAFLACASVQADECEKMAGDVKALVDKLDPVAKGGGNDARLCAAFGEGLGLIKSMRIVSDECLDDGDDRTRILADLDRAIRNLQSQVDKGCS